MNSFNQEYTTIWSFKERGQWATHKGDYPGNCSPYVVKNLLIKYSHKDDVVLDQFVGSGTTVIESLLLNRKAIGVDINENSEEKGAWWWLRSPGNDSFYAALVNYYGWVYGDGIGVNCNVYGVRPALHLNLQS